MVTSVSGAKVWARVLSDLAQVPVAVEWDAPVWVVSWTDGPTRAVVMRRVEDLAGHGVGRPLRPGRMRYQRLDSPVAVALAWLRTVRPADRSGVSAVWGEVEALCEDTGYPQDRADPATLTAAATLAALAQGDRAAMGVLLTQASPPIALAPPSLTGPALTGRVRSYAWPDRRIPEELLGPDPRPVVMIGGECAQCGAALPVRTSKIGRPGRYCSPRCRTAAYRRKLNNVTTP